MTDAESPTRTLTLYMRSLASADSITYLDAVVDRVDRLETSGRIAEYTVEVWDRRVRPATDARSSVGEDIHDTMATFRAWADRAGTSLDSFFTTREVAMSGPEDSYTIVVLPVLTLAEYVDDELTFVAPCAGDETVHTVSSRLDALDAAGGTPPPAPTGSPTPVAPGGDPDV